MASTKPTPYPDPHVLCQGLHDKVLLLQTESHFFQPNKSLLSPTASASVILLLPTFRLLPGPARRNLWQYLLDIRVGKDFLSRTPFAQELGSSFDKWDFTTLKTFYIVKETINWVKGKSTEWEKILAIYISGIWNTSIEKNPHKTNKKTQQPKKPKPYGLTERIIGNWGKLATREAAFPIAKESALKTHLQVALHGLTRLYFKIYMYIYICMQQWLVRKAVNLKERGDRSVGVFERRTGSREIES